MFINNLASLLKAENRYAEARPLFEEALGGMRVMLGDRHPDTLNVLRGMIHNERKFKQLTGRNEGCCCGSGTKFKKCHGWGGA
jgi:uncharacterized protein YecA (UPF0149 family)